MYFWKKFLWLLCAFLILIYKHVPLMVWMSESKVIGSNYLLSLIGSNVSSLRSLLAVEVRMRSSGCLQNWLPWWQECHPASKSLDQLPLMDCTFPPLLFLHRCAFSSFLEGHGGMVLNRNRSSGDGESTMKAANPGLCGKLATKLLCVYIIIMLHKLVLWFVGDVWNYMCVVWNLCKVSS